MIYTKESVVSSIISSCCVDPTREKEFSMAVAEATRRVVHAVCEKKDDDPYNLPNEEDNGDGLNNGKN